MRIIDLHSHWGTKRGYPLRTPEELSQQEKVWRSKVNFVSEEEMAAYFRKMNVKVILDLGFTRFLPIDEVKELHDYAIGVKSKFSDVILGNWISIDPRTGSEGLLEVKRCLGLTSGFLGFVVAGTSSGLPASDSVYDPIYKLCIEAKMPVLITVGFTGLGAGLPGGKGMKLEFCHPRHVDEVAATFPELTIVAGRPAWPWQTEMIAVLLHKSNVWYELHGWSPRYFAGDLKWEIPRRLRNRVMFGGDFPLFSYERLIKDWESEGYSSEVLEKVFYENAEEFLTGLGHKWT